MRNIKSRYRSLMPSHNRTLLLLEIAFKFLFIVLFLPLSNLVLEYLMKLWGQSYITSENLSSFLTYPPVIALLIFLTILSSVFMLFKLTTMINYCGRSYNDRPDIPGLLLYGLIKTIRLIRRGKPVILVFSLMLYIFVNIPLLIGITIYMRIPADVWSGSSDSLFIKSLILIIIAFIGFISFGNIFTLHFCILNNQGFLSGIKSSKSMLKGHVVRIAATLLAFNALLCAVLYAAYYAVLFISALFVYLFTEKNLVITVFLSIYPKINLYMAAAAGMTAFITNINIITSLFCKYLPDGHKSSPVPAVLKRINDPDNKYRPVLAVIMLTVIAFGLLSFYLGIKNDTFQLKDALPGIKIASHRGSSDLAPENTLPALELAIEAHADYAEIDIQAAKDGTLVLMHDRSLKRTTGLNKNLDSLTYEQLSHLDAGRWYDNSFAGTNIPTLEDALKLCKGNIKLNIDVKVYKDNRGLEESLVELINRYGFKHQCIVSSWDYDTLVRIKLLDSDIKTGLILSAAYGNFYGKDLIDFYSIRSIYISKYVVDSAHHAGKEIHAWGVSKVGELERMKAIGVDCIITDATALTRETLYRDDTSKNFIELLNRMLRNRSFYQILGRS